MSEVGVKSEMGLVGGRVSDGGWVLAVSCGDGFHTVSDESDLIFIFFNVNMVF